jgi:hypothetical protein
MKFLNAVDLAKNQILNIVIHNLSAAPALPKEGQIYYNTTDDVIYYWDGAIWVAIGMDVQDGNGLSKSDSGKVRTLNLNVDNASIEIASDALRIKDGGVTTAKLATNAVTTVKIIDAAITFAKIQNMNVMTVLGSIAGGVPHEIAILNEADLVSNSATALATQASIKAYVDATVANIGTLIGGFDASAGGNLPGGAAIKKGAYWYVTVAGTVQSQIFNVGDVIIANVANPTGTNPNHYIFLESNRTQASTTILGMVMLATSAEVIAGVDAQKAITPATLIARTATETRTGLAAIATQAEVTAGTDDAKFVTPLKLKTYFDAKSGCAVADIGNGAALTFAITHILATKDLMVQVLDNGTGEIVYPNISRATTSPFTVTIAFGSENTPTANQYRVIIKKIAI